MFIENKYKNKFLIVKLTKQILEAIDRGLQLSLEDIDDINMGNNGLPIIDGSENLLENSFKTAIKKGNLNTLSVSALRIIFNKIDKFLSLIGLTLEEYYIMRYMHDEHIESYMDNVMKEKYDKNIALFTCKYRKIKSKKALQKLIYDTIEEEGPNCDLNWIDTSEITDMSRLFSEHLYGIDDKTLDSFCGDISKWDVHNVTNMEWMFMGVKNFNCDISNWDVSNVENMEGLFWLADAFNQNISKWNIHKVTNMTGMFLCANSFNQNLSSWNLRNVSTNYMFANCPIKDEYKPKNIVTDEVKNK